MYNQNTDEKRYFPAFLVLFLGAAATKVFNFPTSKEFKKCFQRVKPFQFITTAIEVYQPDERNTMYFCNVHPDDSIYSQVNNRRN